jgi:hypothetical protein
MWFPQRTNTLNTSACVYSTRILNLRPSPLSLPEHGNVHKDSGVAPYLSSHPPLALFHPLITSPPPPPPPCPLPFVSYCLDTSCAVLLFALYTRCPFLSCTRLPADHPTCLHFVALPSLTHVASAEPSGSPRAYLIGLITLLRRSPRRKPTPTAHINTRRRCFCPSRPCRTPLNLSARTRLSKVFLI